MTTARKKGNPVHIRIGSRGSQLALWQANHISALLRACGHEVEIEIIHTTGDKITDVALAKVGAKGMFIKEIEEALAGNRIDLAVHSLKDLPTDLSQQFEIAAVPPLNCARSIDFWPDPMFAGTASKNATAGAATSVADFVPADRANASTASQSRVALKRPSASLAWRRIPAC